MSLSRAFCPLSCKPLALAAGGAPFSAFAPAQRDIFMDAGAAVGVTRSLASACTFKKALRQ